jgi:hypothetical protein
VTFYGDPLPGEIINKFEPVNIYGALQKWVIRIMLFEGKA